MQPNSREDTQPNSRGKAAERGRWYRYNVRLEEDEHRRFDQACAELELSPNAVIRSVIRMLTPSLGVVVEMAEIAPHVPAVVDEGLRRLLIEMYEERARASRAALGRADGA